MFGTLKKMYYFCGVQENRSVNRYVVKKNIV